MENPKKKVLFVITKGNFGGAQRYVYDLATNLPSAEFEAVVACGEGELLKQKLKEVGVRTLDLTKSEREIHTKNDWQTFKDLIRITKDERPNIIHLNSSKIGLIGALASSWLKIFGYKFTTIFTAHNWPFNESHRSPWAKIIYYIGSCLIIILCDKVIAVSEKIKKDVSWMPFTSKKIVVVYNGVAAFKPLTIKASRQFLAGEETKKTLILSLSELHPNKGIDLAIKGFALLPKENLEKLTYCIAGAGEEKEKLQNMAVELGILESVKFLGFVDDAKKYLPGADIFLLPSRNEAFPYAILEAGITGLPIIATCVGGVPEIIQDMQNGILIHPKNPREISEAIMYLLNHKDSRKEFGTKIKQAVTESFSVQRMLSRTLEVYTKI